MDITEILNNIYNDPSNLAHKALKESLNKDNQEFIKGCNRNRKEMYSNTLIGNTVEKDRF